MRSLEWTHQRDFRSGSCTSPLGFAGPENTIRLFYMTLTNKPTPDEREARFQFLEQRNQQLEAVNKIAQIVAASANLDDLLEEALRRILDMLRLDAGSVFLVVEGNSLILKASVGFSAKYRRALSRTRISDQLPGRVIKYREPVIVKRTEPSKMVRTIVKKSEGIVSCAGFPLVVTEECIGVLEVGSTRPRQFAAHEVQLLSAVTSQIAVAVENAQLYEHSANLAISEERNWLAREVHDTLAQHLIALIIQLELAETALGPDHDLEMAAQTVKRALSISRESLEDARASVASLRGSVLDRRPMLELLAELVTGFGERAGVRVETELPAELKPMPVIIEDDLVRVVREALNNIWRHAHAQRVRLSIQRKRGWLTLEIQDNGIGFDPSGNGFDETRFGLRGMSERIHRVGGTLEIETRPGYGTLIRAIVSTTGPRGR